MTLFKKKNCDYTCRIVGKMASPLKFMAPFQKTTTNEMKSKWYTVLATSKKIRRVAQSDVTKFSWKTHRFYWGCPCIPDPKHPERKKIGDVCTLLFKQSVLKTCDQRNDKWAEEVRMRVLDCHDLVALEARYHITCIERFSRNKDQKSSNTTTVGRPVCN